jgi:Rad3-related DNA helicase
MANDLLPPPYAIGVPPKFKEWRHLQEQAVLAASETDRRFVVQAMPTGSGKSLVYMAQAGLTGARTVILTSTKGLQEQLTRDFSDMGLRDIRGMNNYTCRVLDDGSDAHSLSRMGVFGKRNLTSCEHGPCTVGEKCVFKESGCSYYDSLYAVQKAQLVVTNYAYWMSIQNYGGPKYNLGRFDLMVLDEAHDAPDNLSDFLQVELEAQEIEAMLDTRLLDPASAPDAWAEWARYHFNRAKAKVDLLIDEIQQAQAAGDRVSREMRAEARAWKQLAGKLERLAEMKADWIAEPQGRGMRFSPIWPAGYAERFLFKGTPKVVLVSISTSTPRPSPSPGVRSSTSLPSR